MQPRRCWALRFIAYWGMWGTHNAITLCWWNNVIFSSLPQRKKCGPILSLSILLRKKKKKHEMLKAAILLLFWLYLKKKREKKKLQKISIHADFGYLVRRPHYISIPGGKWQINAAHITVSISTWQCMFCMNEYWCTAFPPRWFVFKLTLCLPFFGRGRETNEVLKKKRQHQQQGDL